MIIEETNGSVWEILGVDFIGSVCMCMSGNIEQAASMLEIG